MIYLYALTEATGPVPECGGIASAPLRLLELGGVRAVYSKHDQLDLVPDADTLWRHDQVVERVMGSGSTLPVRFGTTFEHLDAMIDAIEPQLPALRSRIDQVRGCVELAVRVAVPASRRVPPESGRAYLVSRLESSRRRDAVGRRALAPLGKLAVKTRELGRARAEVISASFLVRARDVDSFTAEVRSLQQHGERSLSCTGPWPPYSFADLEERT